MFKEYSFIFLFLGKCIILELPLESLIEFFCATSLFHWGRTEITQFFKCYRNCPAFYFFWSQFGSIMCFSEFVFSVLLIAYLQLLPVFSTEVHEVLLLTCTSICFSSFSSSFAIFLCFRQSSTKPGSLCKQLPEHCPKLESKRMLKKFFTRALLLSNHILCL